MAKTITKPKKDLKPGDVVCNKICKDAIITDFTNLKDWTGQYCTVCLKVVPHSYKKIVPVNDKSKIATSANYEQPKKKKTKAVEKAPEPVTIKEVAEASEGKVVIATMPKAEPVQPQIMAFKIADLLPRLENDTIGLSFVSQDGEVFYVALKSNPEKTVQLLNAKTALIGRSANLEFLSISDTGIPTNPVFKGLAQ